MIKDLMQAIFNEDVDEEDIEETPVKEEVEKEEPVQEDTAVQEPIFQEPTIATFSKPKEEQPIVDSVQTEKKSSIFSGLDVDNIAATDERSVQKSYRFDRRKLRVRHVGEEMDYQAVISPIFGNTEETKKNFDKVHDAIRLAKPEDSESLTQIISPMFGHDIPKAKPVQKIPTVKPEVKQDAKSQASTSYTLKDMLQKPSKTTTKQETLFDKKD